MSLPLIVDYVAITPKNMRTGVKILEIFSFTLKVVLTKRNIHTDVM